MTACEFKMLLIALSSSEVRESMCGLYVDAGTS